MKRIFLFILTLTLALTVNLQAQTRAEKKAIKEAAVKEKIATGIFKIDITQIIPQNQQMINTLATYYIQFNNDSLTCYLPYIGNSTTAVYGSQNLAIESEKQKIKIEKGYDAEEECTGYQFSFRNKNNNDLWKCLMLIYNDGDCRIKLENYSKLPIAYFGKLDIQKITFPKQKKAKKR